VVAQGALPRVFVCHSSTAQAGGKPSRISREIGPVPAALYTFTTGPMQLGLCSYPTGPMQIHMFEEGMTSFGDVCSHAQNDGTISAFDPLYDTRLQLAADDLDPIASLLVIDNVPFFAKTNRDGTHSIILRIAHSAAVVEILSSKLTVLTPHVCGDAAVLAADHLCGHQSSIGRDSIR